MSIFDQINGDIKAAMLAREKVKLEALRGIKKALIEAKTAKGANDELSDEAVIKIIQKLAKQGKDSATVYNEQGRMDLYEVEMSQVEVLQKYLPEQMNDEELTAAVKSIIGEVGATSMKEMGQVMGVATKTLAGKADGKAISAKVKELLG